MTLESRRQQIVAALNGRSKTRKLSQRIERCKRGQCGQCGDLCPVKANKWARDHVSKIVDALTVGKAEVLLLRYTRGVWARKDGELALFRADAEQQPAINELMLTQHASVEKAVRRAFDKLDGLNIVAVGMIDAWYGLERWEIGASVIVAGVAEGRLPEIFPAGFLVTTKVSNIRVSLRKLFADARRAKRTPALSLIARMPKRRQREYFAWLAGQKPNERLFRYGCDRYFNRLEKTKKVTQTIAKKPRPFPYWLQPYWFGYHRQGCLCRACGGPGKQFLHR